MVGEREGRERAVFARSFLCALTGTACKPIWLDEAGLETALEEFLPAGRRPRSKLAMNSHLAHHWL